jgi:hypothetical protein
VGIYQGQQDPERVQTASCDPNLSIKVCFRESPSEAAESTAATPTPASLTVLKLGINGWNWKSALDRNGFGEYDELARLAKNAGLRPGAMIRVFVAMRLDIGEP